MSWFVYLYAIEEVGNRESIRLLQSEAPTRYHVQLEGVLFAVSIHELSRSGRVEEGFDGIAVQSAAPRLSVNVPLLLALEPVVGHAEGLEIVQVSRSSSGERHDVIKLEHQSRIGAEGTGVLLSLQDDLLVRFREPDSLDAGDPKGVPEFGEGASPID